MWVDFLMNYVEFSIRRSRSFRSFRSFRIWLCVVCCVMFCFCVNVCDYVCYCVVLCEWWFEVCFVWCDGVGEWILILNLKNCIGYWFIDMMDVSGVFLVWFVMLVGLMNCENVVVCDMGMGFVKVGYVGDEELWTLFSCMVGRSTLRYEEDAFDDEVMKDVYVGDEVVWKCVNLEILYLVLNGVVWDWEDMGLVWDRAFESLGCDTRECKVMFTDLLLNLKLNCECMMLMMFEMYGFWGVYV